MKAIVTLLILMADVPEQLLLQQGREQYRTGRYAEAVSTLQSAAQQLFSKQEMERYVETGEIRNLPQFETAMVYLALAQARLGQDQEARQTILRLAAAERIDAVYATLPLEQDAAEFEALAARLAPDIALPANQQLASMETTTAIEPVQPRVVESPPPPPPAPAPAPAPAVAAESVEERLAAERARLEREADERIAAERAAAQRAADERIAAETAAIRRAAEEQIAAERAAAQQAAEERVAAECAAAEKALLERIAAEREAADRAARERIAAAQSEARRTHMETLRQAETLAESGRVAEAVDLYMRVANAEGAPREVVAAAATGLYRTGAFSEAARAFRRLGTFGRGEEDLRYYFAVALYETGNYGDARKELACALPFIQATDDVGRYRMKIEQTTVVMR